MGVGRASQVKMLNRTIRPIPIRLKIRIIIINFIFILENTFEFRIIRIIQKYFVIIKK